MPAPEIKIVENFMELLEAGDIDRATSYLSDDFTFSGLTPTTLSRERFIEAEQAILSAFPDRSFTTSNVRKDAGLVRAEVHFKGTTRAG